MKNSPYKTPRKHLNFVASPRQPSRASRRLSIRSIIALLMASQIGINALFFTVLRQNVFPSQESKTTPSNYQFHEPYRRPGQQQQNHFVDGSPKTAVVVTLSHVQECDAVRLRHLVETAGMDVWVLHAHEKLAQNHSDWVETSNHLLGNIPGIQIFPQVQDRLGVFDSKVSGPTKSSFLRFLVSHPRYSFGWHLESDVFFTGNWSDVLWLEDQKTDFIFTKAWNKTDSNWWNKLAKGQCLVDGNPCRELAPFQFYWMLARVSRTMATDLLQSLEDESISGHHEAITAAFCKSRGYSTGGVPSKYIGATFHAGNIKPRKERDLERRSNSLAQGGTPHPSKLYHPIKCEAYSSASVMQAEINQWIT